MIKPLFPSDQDISIHALRVEGDVCALRRAADGVSISIHALRVEGDQIGVDVEKWTAISIHALRVEGDPLSGLDDLVILEFLSTPSGWRATADRLVRRRGLVISIHALRVEGDKIFLCFKTVFYDFYPRPPGGGRPCQKNA